nr:spore cortex-lytic enzyme [Ammoniphilus resinae]
MMVTTGNHTYAASSTIQMGNNNGDVWDLQYRLKVLGYYDSTVDGVYGWQTWQAVRNFQSDYGIKIDGTVGAQTMNVLKKVSVNQNELDMLARMIHAEARGELYTGQVAVGAVIMNRLKSPLFPNTMQDVLFQRFAFSAIDDGQYWNNAPNATAYRAAMDAVRGWDPTNGALYYFNPKTATSSWIWTRPQLVSIGNHTFMK